MTNKEIRAHLRKGELAVELLEKLGYIWKPNVNLGPSVWQEPEKKSLLCKLEELIASEVEKQKPSPVPERPLQVGDRFMANAIPRGNTALPKNCPEWRSKIFRAGEVDFNTDRGPVVRFGLGTATRGYWLPLSLVTRIPHDADF